MIESKESEKKNRTLRLEKSFSLLKVVIKHEKEEFSLPFSSLEATWGSLKRLVKQFKQTQVPSRPLKKVHILLCRSPWCPNWGVCRFWDCVSQTLLFQIGGCESFLVDPGPDSHGVSLDTMEVLFFNLLNSSWLGWISLVPLQVCSSGTICTAFSRHFGPKFHVFFLPLLQFVVLRTYHVTILLSSQLLNNFFPRFLKWFENALVKKCC